MAAAPAPNLFGLHQYDGLTSFFGGQTFEYGGYVLPPAAGWIVIILFGFIFALLAVFLVWVDIKFSGAVYNSEQFNTAGRSIGTGLLAVDIVSHWTWASILLQCTSYGWFYGAFGSYWYAVSGAVTVALFAVVGLELKHKAPKAHTMLEVVYVRWGRAAHITFFFFAVLTNLLVSLSMLQGCVSAVNALTGVSVYAMAFLIPIGVVFYAAIGGLKSTFTTSYFHTVIVYVVCCVFMFKVFLPNGLLNGIDDVYNRLQIMAVNFPVAQQQDGSYKTAFSLGGFQFDVILWLSSLAQMLVDQAYWQSAIAAKASSAAKGYFLAAFLYMSIVFVLPLSLGLYAVALDLPVSLDEAYAGLIMPASAFVMLGKSGAILVIIICFMAVTSSGASEMLAVSSLFTFDVYRRYINPKASGARLVMVSRVGVCCWAVFMGVIMCIAQIATINVNWLITIIGVLTGGAVPPLACVLTWSRCTGKAAISAAVIGTCCGITSWLVVAYLMEGSITILNTEANAPLLAGNCISIGLSAILVLAISLAFPEKKFNWELLKENITTAEDVVKKQGALDASSVESAAEQEEIARIRRPVHIAAGIVAFAGFFLWPLLTLPAGSDWGVGYFRWYVILGFVFILLATAIGTFMPIWEARNLFTKFITGQTFTELVDKSFRGGSRHGSKHGNGVANGKEVQPGMDDSAHGASKLEAKPALAS